jgi:hypothetical protein
MDKTKLIIKLSKSFYTLKVNKKQLHIKTLRKILIFSNKNSSWDYFRTNRIKKAPVDLS